METQMQNPSGCIAGVSRNQLGGWLQSPSTPSKWQAQLLGRCFCLSQPLARDMARLCFGEGSYD